MENNKNSVHFSILSLAFKTEYYTDISDTLFFYHNHFIFRYQQFQKSD